MCKSESQLIKSWLSLNRSRKDEIPLSSSYSTSPRPSNSLKLDQLLDTSLLATCGMNNYTTHLHPTEERTERLPESAVSGFNFHTQNHLIYFANSRGPRDNFSQENPYVLLLFLWVSACLWRWVKESGEYGYMSQRPT